MLEQLDTMVEYQMDYIRARILNMAEDQYQFDALNALYEEYRELLTDEDVDLLSINSDSGEITEYVVCCE